MWNVQYTRVVGILQLLPGYFRWNDVTSGHQRSRDVISFHVTASYCDLQTCRKWNVQYTRVFGLLYPLPCDFRSNDGTSASLPVILGHVTPFPATLLSPNASYSLEVKCTVYASFRHSTATSRWLPVKWRRFRVTSSHQRSRDVISFNVTASYCELQPCRKWNVQYTRVFGLLQPLTGDFRLNNVTYGSLPVTRGHVKSFSVTWLPSTASYGFVRSEMYSVPEFSTFYIHF